MWQAASSKKILKPKCSERGFCPPGYTCTLFLGIIKPHMRKFLNFLKNCAYILLDAVWACQFEANIYMFVSVRTKEGKSV